MMYIHFKIACCTKLYAILSDKKKLSASILAKDAMLKLLHTYFRNKMA